MDAKFLRQVQDEGWIIKSVDEDEALVACPRAGCDLKVRLKEGRKIPTTCGPTSPFQEMVVRSFEDVRQMLWPRRLALDLTIKDVEAITGMAPDHLAKMEKDNPSRIPNIETLILWAEGLGFQLVLRHTGLTPYALRTIEQTRQEVKKRRVRQTYHKTRRKT